MARQLYERWLIEGAGATLAEFVAAERARVRQARTQLRLWAAYGPQMQQAAHPWTNAALQSMAQQTRFYGSLSGGLGGIIGGWFR